MAKDLNVKQTVKHNVNKDGLTHDQLQAICWKRACNEYGLYGLLIAIPNDSIIGIARWKQNEAMGVTPGVWDMVLFWKDGVYWFEFKVGVDKLSEKQRKFQNRIKMRDNKNHSFFIISDEKTFMHLIDNIIS